MHSLDSSIGSTGPSLPDPPFPLLGPGFNEADFTPLKLGPELSAETLEKLSSFEGLAIYVQEILDQARAKVGYGGYREKRMLYRTSRHFGEDRNIHLGLDLWVSAGTPVFCPLSGTIHSLAFNDKPLDYGATIIVEHSLPSGPLFSLYGHLSKSSIEGRRAGEAVAAGDILAYIGEKEENGGWVPHLHFQLIMDMEGWSGDYPGVTTEDEAQSFFANCPNPDLLFSKSIRP